MQWFTLGILLTLLGMLKTTVYCSEMAGEQVDLLEVLYYQRVPRPLKLDHPGAVARVRFNKDGSKLLAAGCEILSAWCTYTGRQLLALDHEKTDIVDAWFTKDGEHVITQPKDKSKPYACWSVESGQYVGSLTSRASLDCHKGPHSRENADFLIINKAKVLIVSRKNRQTLLELCHKKAVNAACFNHNRTVVASGTKSGSVFVWNVGKTIRQRQAEDNLKKSLQKIETRRMLESFSEIGL